MRVNTDRMLAMIDAAVAGSAPFLPVRLVVFPEFAHAAPVFPTVAELTQKLAVPIPNEHTERLQQKAKEHDVYIQSGSMLESDPKWPGHVFNSNCIAHAGGALRAGTQAHAAQHCVDAGCNARLNTAWQV